MESLDCKSCHKLDEKSIGPSYTDVAKKYSNDNSASEYLVNKIIRGGSGVWGEVAMPAHADLGRSAAQLIVTYIRSLAKEDKKEAITDASQDPDYQKGLSLIAKNDCLTCHKIDETLTGPAYREVANKYAGTSDTVVNYLAGKIISGGSGVWGRVYMKPHPGITK